MNFHDIIERGADSSKRRPFLTFSYLTPDHPQRHPLPLLPSPAPLGVLATAYGHVRGPLGPPVTHDTPVVDVAPRLLQLLPPPGIGGSGDVHTSRDRGTCAGLRLLLPPLVGFISPAVFTDVYPRSSLLEEHRESAKLVV